MLLKTPSLSASIFLFRKNSVPVWSGQEPERSRVPFASVKKVQSPNVHGIIPSCALDHASSHVMPGFMAQREFGSHSAPCAVRNRERRETIKSPDSTDRPLL
jgi:hypothetical protein